MSQFKKYLAIVNEGRDLIYNEEESETVEKYISNIKRLIPVQMKKFENNFSNDPTSKDTEEMFNLLESLELRLKAGASEEELFMVKELIEDKDFREMFYNSSILISKVNDLKKIIKSKYKIKKEEL